MRDLFKRKLFQTSTHEDIGRAKSLSGSLPTALYSPPHSPRSIRSTQSGPPASSVNAEFEDLWDDSLDYFFDHTGVDLSDRNHDLYQRLQNCSSPDSVAQTLEGIALEFRSYRKGSKRAARIRSVLSSVTHGVSMLIDVGAESAAAQVRSISPFNVIRL